MGRWGVVVVLAVFLLVAYGCATKTEDPRAFVGSWEEVVKEGAVYRTTFELRPDGAGFEKHPPDPHAIDLAWHLRGNKLVLAPKDGSRPTRFDYRFDSPDELVLILNATEIPFKRKAAGP